METQLRKRQRPLAPKRSSDRDRLKTIYCCLIETLHFSTTTPTGQTFFERDIWGQQKPKCPSQSGLQPTKNPYYNPESPKHVDPSNKQSNAGAADSIYQPIGSFPWVGSAGSVANANQDRYNEAGLVANANVDLSNVADTNPADLTIPSNSSPAKLSPNFAPLPGELASTIGVDLNLAGSNGDDCIGYGCGVASFMQSIPNTSKRSMPVEFRA
ncbi:hypothetical protein MMC07_004027 [Pseudocyphellaria aurata]|nr:hypothetical protein [Pseudocyphellaria aurata]